MFEPRIVCFFCKWCTYAGADLAGTSRKQYPPNGVVVRVNCSGRIDPQFVLWAFREGADGVLIGGCHPGDCHYQDGNYKTMRRVAFLRRMLEDVGVDPDRLHLEWISAAEGDKLVRVMTDFVDSVRKMGPLDVERAGDGRWDMALAPPVAARAPSKKAAARARAAKKSGKGKAAKTGTAKTRKPSSARRATEGASRKAVRKKAVRGKPERKKPAAGTARRASSKASKKRAGRSSKTVVKEAGAARGTSKKVTRRKR